MPPKRSQRSRSRQTTPQSPPKQSASRATPLHQTRSTRSRSVDKTSTPQRIQINRNLPALAEEHRPEDNQDEAEQEQEDEIVVVQPNAPSDNGSNDAVNPLDLDDLDDLDDNDTSSNGDTQLQSLDPDLIIDNLPILFQAAEAITSLFNPDRVSEILKEINLPTSRTSKRLANTAAQLHNARSAYGGGAYISVPLVLRKLLEDSDDNGGPWKPDAVLQLANLSLMVTDLAQGNARTIYDTLERMYNTFPEPFGLYLTSAELEHGSHSVRETVSYGIDLRIQFFIKCVEESKSKPSFDPDDILLQTFFDEDGRLRGFQAEGEHLPKKIESTIMDQINAVRRFFGEDSKRPIDLVNLKQNLPWQQFLEYTFRWVFLRAQELKDQIAAQGGVMAIRDRLERRELASYPAPPSSSVPKASHSARKVQQHPTSDVVVQPQQHSPSSPRSKVLADRVKRMAQIVKAQETFSSEDDSEDEEDEDDEDEDVDVVQYRGNGAVIDQRDQRREGTVQETPAKSRAQAREIPASPSVVDHEESEHAAGGSGDESDGASQPESEPELEPEEVARHTAAVSNGPKSVHSEAEVSISMNDGDSNSIDDGDDHIDKPKIMQQSPPKPTQSSIVPTQQTLAVLAVAKEQHALGNKENSRSNRPVYADRQANATRINWDDSEVGTKRPRAVSSGKAIVTDEQDDESDEFETDTRPSKRLRAVENVNVGAEGDQRPVDGGEDEIQEGQEEDEEEDEDEDEDEDEEHAEEPPAAASSRNIGSQIPPSAQAASRRQPLQELTLPREEPINPLPSQTQPRQVPRPARSPTPDKIPSSTAEQHLTVNARAKATVRLRTIHEPDARRVHPHAQRRPWTYPETTRLFEMIELHGCQWALILTEDAAHQDGPELQHRSQVQLKDKARNLKMDYLKAGEELPVGFAGVTIKATDKDLLRKLGMPYE